MSLPRDVDVTTTPVWILTTDGLPPFATPAAGQTLFFDYDDAHAARQNAPAGARLWKAELTATAALSKWQEA